MPNKSVVILGIHSNLDGTESNPDISNTGEVLSQFTAGHAWISIIVEGINVRYGLWPDRHPRTVDNGPGTDIRKNMEPTLGKANRFYKLTDIQANKLLSLLNTNTTWKETNNCSSWASHVVYEVIGKNIDADDWLGFETPRELGKSINKLEKKEPTTIKSPKELNNNSSSW